MERSQDIGRKNLKIMSIRDLIGGNPSIDYGVGKGTGRRTKKMSHEAQVQDFFSDPEKFQALCQWQQNGLEVGMLMQVCISEAARRYPTSAEPEGDIVDFLINYKDYHGLCNYKTKKSPGRRAKGLEYRLYYAETRMVTKIKGTWGGIKILAGDDYLSQQKSDAAFLKYSQLCGYELTSGQSSFAEAALQVAGAREIEKKIRLSSARNAQGEKRYLLILLDNGKMLDLAPEQVSEVRYFIPSAFGIIKTELCFFKHTEGGNLEFMK